MYTVKSIFSAISVAALLAAAAVPQMASASEYYSGTATLCAVDMSGASFETKGKNGVTYTYNQVLVYRIDTDHDMIHGWEVLTSNNKAPSKGKGGYFWGDAVLAPDSYGGTLVDHFKFPVAKADSISSTYHGDGDLEGVVVDYALTPAGPDQLPTDTDTCAGIPWVCDPPGCFLLFPGIVAGYLMTGEVITDE